MSGKKAFPRRGEIYWVNLEPAVGGETRKKRPGLIVSNDIGNEKSSVAIVAPITSKASRVYPFEVAVDVAGKYAKIMLHQCRAVDKFRLETKLDHLDFDIMRLVDEAIRIAFGLN